METLLADEFHQLLLIPDEETRLGMFTFHPDGRPYPHCPDPDCTHRFAEGVFQADAEGILLYRCIALGEDSGSGWIVVSDQRPDRTEFEFFDRLTRRHLGHLRLTGVSNTDGIASTQQGLPGFPMGLFAAVDDDRRVSLIGWDTILEATGLSCFD